MQVQKRIYAPFMPQGTPDLTNAPTPVYAPGEIGCYFNDQNTGGEYLRVLLDSGATSATSVGLVKAGQLAFWKDAAAGIVTNDKRFCDLGVTASINRVAGIFQLAVTPGGGVNGADGQPLMYMCDLIVKKDKASVYSSGTLAAGGLATADTTASTAQAISTTAGTAAPSQILGVWTSATVANSLGTCDVNIGFQE